MTEYRVKEEGANFIPQQSKFFIWCNFYNTLVGNQIIFDTLSDAVAFIRFKQKRSQKKRVVYHSVENNLSQNDIL